MLEIKNIFIGYGKKSVVKDVSFSLGKGSLTALLGRNGSGKSTLLSALGGAVAYKGEMFWEGERLDALSSRERATRVAFLPQMLPIPSFTVAETVMCGRNPYMTLSQRPSPQDIRTVEQMLSEAGIASLRERSLPTLSGGERQMVFLAMVLAQKTPLLLLDEPTSFLDKAKEKRFLSTLLTAQRREGLTVLAAMHDLTAAVRLADRFLVLSEGELIFDGTKEMLLAEQILEKTFDVCRYDTDRGPVFV